MSILWPPTYTWFSLGSSRVWKKSTVFMIRLVSLSLLLVLLIASAASFPKITLSLTWWCGFTSFISIVLFLQHSINPYKRMDTLSIAVPNLASEEIVETEEIGTCTNRTGSIISDLEELTSDKLLCKEKAMIILFEMSWTFNLFMALLFLIGVSDFFVLIGGVDLALTDDVHLAWLIFAFLSPAIVTALEFTHNSLLFVSSHYVIVCIVLVLYLGIEFVVSFMDFPILPLFLIVWSAHFAVGVVLSWIMATLAFFLGRLLSTWKRKDLKRKNIARV